MGLDNLVQLKDLSLYQNSITTIENLNNCRKLECLSLGNNLIADVEQVSVLRTLPKLQVVSFDGNPFVKAKGDSYKHYILGYLPRLKYLDYTLVRPADVCDSLETVHHRNMVTL